MMKRIPLSQGVLGQEKQLDQVDYVKGLRTIPCYLGDVKWT